MLTTHVVQRVQILRSPGFWMTAAAGVGARREACNASRPISNAAQRSPSVVARLKQSIPLVSGAAGAFGRPSSGQGS